MKCTRCGTELAVEEQFCGECGAPRRRLPARFEETEEQFAALRRRRSAGELSETEYQAALKKLIVQDAEGTYWMLGTESGKWNRYDGRDWIGADPPTESAESAQTRATAASPSPPPVQRRLPWVLIALGGAGLLGIVACVLGFVLLSAMSPRAETVLAPTAAPGSTLPFPTQAATTAPRAVQPTVTSGGAESRSGDGSTYYPVPADGLVTMTDPGLSLSAPAGWLSYTQDPDYITFWPSETDTSTRLLVYWDSATVGSTADEELRSRTDKLSDVSLSSVSLDSAAIGDLAWCTGTSGGIPFYAAVAGPDAQNRILFWFGLYQVGAESPLALFKESAEQSRYTE